MKRIFMTACVFFLISVHVKAEENLMGFTVYLDEINVVGTSETAQALQTTEKKVVEKNRSSNIADFLAKDPEITVTRKAAFGDSGDIISIRGMGGNRIMLNVDGRNISSVGNVGGNYIDYGTVPLDNLERIEVIKGGSSAEYGNSAIGGVINAYTKRPTNEGSASFYATMGGWDKADDYYLVRGSAAKKFGNVGLSIGASHQKAQPYLRNNDYKALNLNPKLYFTPWRDSEIILGYKYSRTERGLIVENNRKIADFKNKYPVSDGESFAGGGGAPALTVLGDGAYWDKEKHMIDMTYSQVIGDNSYIELLAYKNFEDRMERNYADNDARIAAKKGKDPYKYGDVADDTLVMKRKVKTDRSYGYKAKGITDIEQHTVTAGAEFKAMRNDGIRIIKINEAYNNAPMTSSGGSKADVTGFFISDSYRINDMLTAELGGRYDYYDAENKNKNFNDGKLTPKTGLVYRATRTDTFAVYVYQNYRTPTLPEVAWNFDGSFSEKAIEVLKGKVIKPETANAADVAYKHTFNDGYVQLSGYYYDIKDYIIQKNFGKGVRGSYNTDAEFLGVSLAVQYDITDSFRVNAGGTYQKTKKKNDPFDTKGILNKVDYIPDYKANAGISWDVSKKLTLDTGLVYVGKRYYTEAVNPPVKESLGSYTVLDASLRYKLNANTVLEVYAENISDKKYEEIDGFPAMKFNMGASIRWTL